MSVDGDLTRAAVEWDSALQKESKHTFLVSVSTEFKQNKTKKINVQHENKLHIKGAFSGDLRRLHVGRVAGRPTAADGY